MDSENASTSDKMSAPLFPAYSSTIQNRPDDEKRDWLCNSSFLTSTFEQIYTKDANLQDVEIKTENDTVPIEVIPPIPSGKKKKSKKRKKTHENYQNLSSFSVPENESILSQLKKKTFIEETGLSFERAFLTDPTGDPENLMFECFERTRIANYRISVKFPFGLSIKESAVWCVNVQKPKHKNANRYFSKSFLKSLKATVNQENFITKDPLKNVCLEYIPISASPSNIQHSEQIGSGPNFADVSSSWKTPKRENENLIKDKISEESSLEKDVRDKIIFFNKRLTEDPSNIEMWLSFIDFQDQLLITDKEVDKKVLMYSETSINEKKIAIVEKALKYNPKDVSLNIKKLKLYQGLHDADKLTSMWDELIFLNPNNPQVWQEYLLYFISNLRTFNMPSILKLYGKCLKTLSNLWERITESHEPFPDIVPNMLNIFSQLCFILKSCGYTEKAIALYQAFIEFNLFCDASFEDLAVDERIVYFEPFWDSGAERIGEKNSIGWSTTMQQKKVVLEHISTDSDLNYLEDEILYKKLSISETWLEFERLRQSHHWLPWRPNPDYDQTSEDVDDIDRTVPFDDVSKFLFCISDEMHKFLSVIHFVVFLGFDIHLLGCHNMANRMIYNPMNVDDYENISKVLNMDLLVNPSKDPLCFNSILWNDEKFEFINNIFTQVSNKFSSKYKTLLTFIWLKFQRHYVLEVKENKTDGDISDLKKFAKSILKKSENRNCLLLWFEYIQIEWLSDKINAKKTFQMLLISSTSAISSGNMHLQELWYFIRSYLDLYVCHLETSTDKMIVSPNEILYILIHAVNKEKFAPYTNQDIKATTILKAVTEFKNYLEKEFNLLCASETILCSCVEPYAYSLINCAKCFAYFQYFSQGCDAAIQVYENIISQINSKATELKGKHTLQQLYIAEAELLNFHTSNSTASIKPLQTFLFQSVKKYPYNSKLLYLLVKLRNSSSVISPTRRFLTEILKDQKKSDPVTWIFALAAEYAICYALLRHNKAETESQSYDDIITSLGINWRIRALYERMLKTDLCTHVPILWRSYIKFEIMTKNIERAKSIFYKALQTCGWSKELIMDGIEYFPDQQNQILAYMTQKQMRVHTPLEEVTLLMEHAIKDS